MGKRFTETTKWSDKWFRTLEPSQKLGWLYILDNCDQSGVIELDEGLADFQIGGAVDWHGLFAASEGRVERLENGKLWVSKFVNFQYGKLSAACKPHVPVLRLIEKNGLSQRVLIPYQYTTNTLEEKERVSPSVTSLPKDQIQEGETETSEEPEKRAQKKELESQIAHGFESFWSAYPEKNGKKQAAEAYRKAIDRLSKAIDTLSAIEKLTTAALEYRHFLENHPSPPLAKYAQGWLNAERYETDYGQSLADAVARHRRAEPKTFAQAKLENTTRALQNWTPPIKGLLNE